MKTRSDRRLAGLLLVLVASGRGLSAIEANTSIAALKGTEVIIVNGNKGTTTKLSGDPRPKWALRWLPDGHTISYLVPGERGHKTPLQWRMEPWPKLVITDVTGHPSREIALSPARNSANPESIRAIEKVEWLSNSLVRLEASFGPRNCAVFDVDVDAGTGEALAEHDTECDSLRSSPDGAYIAYFFPEALGAWEDRVERIEIDKSPARIVGGPGIPAERSRSSIDDAPVSYAGAPGKPIHFDAGPAWSADSQRVALLERQVPPEVGRGDVPLQTQSGPMTLTTISIRGEVIKVVVPGDVKNDPTLTWIGSRVAIGSGNSAIVVDPASKRYQPVDFDSAAIIEKAVAARRAIADDRTRLSDALRQLGAREGVRSPK